MSKRKHNVAYIKPEEPKFLRLLKEQAGYKEGPTVNTKRSQFYDESDEEREEREDREEEKPVVVVLKDGDLTAEEFEVEKKKQEDAEASAPADLSKKVIFNKSKKSVEKSKKELEDPAMKKAKKTEKQKVVLSFDQEEEEENLVS